MEQVCNSKLAKTPPMGWNSWDCFGLDVTEQEVKENAKYMAEHLKEYGWEYIIVDLGWYAPGVTTTNYKRKNIPMITDEFGRLIPVEERFPSSKNGKGFKPLADFVHSLGLKFGIHIMRGMPWIAVKNKQVIKGTNITCDKIAEEDDQCLWYGSMHGIDCTKEGAQEYYDSLIDLYTSWDVDFIKADDMGSWDGDGLNSPMRTDEIEALSTAIKKYGNKIVLSISPGAAYIGNAYHLSRHAHMWRISCDFWDNWEALKRQFPRCEAWSKRKVAGHWPDADMLPLGKIGIRGEVGESRNTNFTHDEQITLMTLWAIFQSPLMFGGDLPQTDYFTISLITNREVIELNQNSKNSKQIYADDEIIVWTAENKSINKQYIDLFKISDIQISGVKIEQFVNELLPMRDIWNNKKIENENDINIAPHGAILLVKE